MLTKKLKLNHDKPSLFSYAPKICKHLPPQFPVIILGNQVLPAQNIRNLGVVFKYNFNLSDHVSLVIKCTSIHARDLYRRVTFKLAAIVPTKLYSEYEWNI